MKCECDIMRVKRISKKGLTLKTTILWIQEDDLFLSLWCKRKHQQRFRTKKRNVRKKTLYSELKLARKGVGWYFASEQRRIDVEYFKENAEGLNVDFPSISNVESTLLQNLIKLEFFELFENVESTFKKSAFKINVESTLIKRRQETRFRTTQNQPNIDVEKTLCAGWGGDPAAIMNFFSEVGQISPDAKFCKQISLKRLQNTADWIENSYYVMCFFNCESFLNFMWVCKKQNCFFDIFNRFFCYLF